MSVKTKANYRTKRHERIRKKIRGTADRPRMAVMVSNKNIYVQFIDDDAGKTLASVSCKDEGKVNVALAEALGKKAADEAKAAGIASVVFDRSGHKFHGMVKAVAAGVTKEGLLGGVVSPDTKKDGDESKGVKAKDKEE
jgi:large subunit ribosomal protein L18